MPPPEYIALYGTLRAHGVFPGRPDLSRQLKPAGDAVIDARLFDLGAYPGLTLGAGRVQAELFEILDPGVLAVMDRFETFDPGDVAGSEYVRRMVGLVSPEVDAWVYVYNRPVEPAALIGDGDWIRHAAGRN